MFHQWTFCRTPEWPNSTWCRCWTQQGGETCAPSKCYCVTAFKCFLLEDWSLSVVFSFTLFPPILFPSSGEKEFHRSESEGRHLARRRSHQWDSQRSKGEQVWMGRKENTEDLLTVKRWNSTFSRLKKKEFSLEEIYTNKNYKSPTSNRWRQNASDLLWRRSTGPRIKNLCQHSWRLFPQDAGDNLRGATWKGWSAAPDWSPEEAEAPPVSRLHSASEEKETVGYDDWDVAHQSCNLKADWIPNTG